MKYPGYLCCWLILFVSGCQHATQSQCDCWTALDREISDKDADPDRQNSFMTKQEREIIAGMTNHVIDRLGLVVKFLESDDARIDKTDEDYETTIALIARAKYDLKMIEYELEAYRERVED